MFAVHWLAEQIALEGGTAHVQQAHCLPMAFYTFGSDLHIKLPRQIEHQFNDCEARFIYEHGVDKALVDFDDIDRQAPQMCQRRIARPEVIERHGQTFFANVAALLQQCLPSPAGRQFPSLQAQAYQAGYLSKRTHLRSGFQVAPHEIGGADIEANPSELQPSVHPFTDIGRDMIEHARRNVMGNARVCEGLMKLRRRYD